MGFGHLFIPIDLIGGLISSNQNKVFVNNDKTDSKIDKWKWRKREKTKETKNRCFSSRKVEISWNPIGRIEWNDKRWMVWIKFLSRQVVNDSKVELNHVSPSKGQPNPRIVIRNIEKDEEFFEIGFNDKVWTFYERKVQRWKNKICKVVFLSAKRAQNVGLKT